MINRRAAIRATKRVLLAVFLTLTMSSVSQAGPLNVSIEPFPSIAIGYMTNNYDALTGNFTATGWALTLDTSATTSQNITTTFKLVATISNLGVASSNATLTVGDAASPLLFSQKLLNFGFSPTAGGTLEFLFAPVSGSYVTSGVYSPTKPLDVQMQGAGFVGNFNTSWFSSSNTGQIREDPPVSEPSTLLLLLAGVGITGGLRNRARARGTAAA